MGVRTGGGEGHVAGSDGSRFDGDLGAGGGAGAGAGGGGGGGGGSGLQQASLVASDVVQVAVAEPFDVVGGTVTTHDPITHDSLII